MPAAAKPEQTITGCRKDTRRLVNEKTIRELYVAAEGREEDIKKFVFMFSDEEYMRDVPNGAELRGQVIGDSISFVRLLTDSPPGVI